MANALFVDALKGYEIYLSRRGKITLENVNELLIEKGRNPIALRTYGHYRKLLQNGFRSYIPINKFDVFQSLGRIQVAADRRRYERHPADIPVQISRDGKKWQSAQIINKSIVGFGILTDKRFPTSTGVSGWISMDGCYDIPVVIVWRQHYKTSTRLGVRAMEYIARYRIIEIDRVTRPLGAIRISRIASEELEWENIFGVLVRVDELIKSTTDLIYILEDFYDIEIDLTRPQLEYIRFGSPGDTSIKIDLGIADIIRVVLDKIQFLGLQKRKLRAEVEAQELSNDAVRLANKNTEIEILRNAVKLSKEVGEKQLNEELANGIKEIIPDVLGVSKVKPETLSLGSPERAILDERLIPATTDLVAGDDSDYMVEVVDGEDDVHEKGDEET